MNAITIICIMFTAFFAGYASAWSVARRKFDHVRECAAEAGIDTGMKIESKRRRRYDTRYAAHVCVPAGGGPDIMLHLVRRKP